MQVAASIFKAYDIRGVTPTALNEGVAEALGLAFGTQAMKLGEKTVAVGRDGRLSGPGLSAALIRGLVAAGVDVIDIGLATTPMLYFAASTLCTSGIQVTGSHNPKDYNGFKMVLAGRAIYGEDIQALRKTMEAETHQRADGGRVRLINVSAAYQDRIVSDAKLARPMKVVVDCGNGVAGASAPAIFRALGCEVIELFSEVDGNFPNHHPDPSKPENLQDVIRTLRETDAELGLAFDGDGDRLGIVTKDGATIYPDRQMILFAQDVLSRVPGGNIIYDVKCSQRLAPAIRAGLVHGLSVTGANLEESLFRLVAHHSYKDFPDYRYFTKRDDTKILKQRMRRVTDTSIPEDEAFRAVEKILVPMWVEATKKGERRFWHEYFYELVLSLPKSKFEGNPDDCWLLAAAKANLPMVVPVG